MAMAADLAHLVDGAADDDTAAAAAASCRPPVELAIDLAHSPGTRLNLHLTVLAHSVLLFLASTSPDASAGAGPAPMGSLVYAMPDRYHPAQPLSTTIYSVASTVDFATRMAKVLARRLAMPCYVGCSINLAHSAGGGSMEEEVEAFRAIVAAVVTRCEKAKAGRE